MCDLRRYSCAPLSLEYLKTVSALALLSQHVEHVELPAQQVLHQLFADVAHYCWVSITEDDVEPEQDSGNPMVSVALKTAAALYFRHLRGFHGQGKYSTAQAQCTDQRKRRCAGRLLYTLCRHCRRGLLKGLHLDSSCVLVFSSWAPLQAHWK